MLKTTGLACIRPITEELNVVSDKCNGHVLPSNHVCRNVKAFENSAQCLSQSTHSIVNGLKSLTFVTIFLNFMSFNSFRSLVSFDTFYPIDNNPDDSIVIISANRSSRYFVPFVKSESNVIENYQAVTATLPTPVDPTP